MIVRFILTVLALVTSAGCFGLNVQRLSLSDPRLPVDARRWGADAEDAYSTDNPDGDTKEDINLKEAKEVFMSEGIIAVAADSYVYVANAGTGNGTTDASSAVLTVVIEYIGMT